MPPDRKKCSKPSYNYVEISFNYHRVMGVKFLVVFDIRRISHIFHNSIGLSRSKNMKR